MYEYTDKIIRYLSKQIIRIFAKAKGTMLKMDELSVLSYSTTMYQNLYSITFNAYWLLAKKVYKDNLTVKDGKITKDWVLSFLEEYNPVTKYVFSHEVERKEARFAESVIASINKAAEINKAMRFWSQMQNQYALDITDAAAKKAYKDSGVAKVQWITADDDKCCKTCRERNKVVYDMDKLPPKPHWGCRCTIKPYYLGVLEDD